MSEEEYAHYETIRSIVKDEVAPINRNINIFMAVALGVFGFMFLTQFAVYKDLQSKAIEAEVERDYLQKLNYYQIEEDEHRILLEMAPDVNKATTIYNKINDNIATALGFKYTTRGTTKLP
jgi:hypothetical protein